VYITADLKRSEVGVNL